MRHQFSHQLGWREVKAGEHLDQGNARHKGSGLGKIVRDSLDVNGLPDVKQPASGFLLPLSPSCPTMAKTIMISPMPDLIVKEFGSMQVKTIGSITFMGNEMKFWAWSPYEKCSFRCVFCSVEAQGKSKPQITQDEIGPLLDDFERLAGKRYPFALGSCTDGYPAEEAEYQLTRHTLQELSKRPGIRTVLITHGDMIVRDIDILKSMPNLETIGMSIPHHDNEQIRRLEPGAPSFESRIAAARLLHEAGLPIHVNIAPWIPGMTEADRIARELPAEMTVNVGVLSYNRHQHDMTKYLFGRDIPSAERVFGKQFATQQDINAGFLEAHKKTGGGTRGNLRWLIPPGSGRNYINYLPNP
jgi:DNA repair photolyase